MKTLAVCLLSGGLDSCVSAAEAKAVGHDLALLHIRYGQLTQRREEASFERIADYLQPSRRLVIELPHLQVIGGSALTDPSMGLDRGSFNHQEVPNSYVPFRNANLLAAAVSWAEVLGAGSIYLGAVAEDGSGYPDCQEPFFVTFQRVIELGTRPTTDLRLVTPLLHLTKAQIVRRGVQLRAPLDLTWSCYREEDLACGECDSCLLRLRGFKGAGVTDPIPYR